ncbi:DNA cytosine methyltransferase [Amycolatopsis kentuckyensis]|uniref:DNA cytosine methyltransferase n=1 Tax=Amycolatopsis kentuckyensis TaxID=218823 RepID=UPI00356637C8
MSSADEEALGLFGGPGGWDCGARLAGFTGPMKAVEIEDAPCRTATAAGHQRIKADVSKLDPRPFAGRTQGLKISPPCPPYSISGRGGGKLDRAAVEARIDAFARGEQPADVEWHDPRSHLTAEPMRWAVALRPRWIACEQVPGALPLWRHIGGHLEQLGYSVVTGVLSAEQYGVPQVRRRAVLIARRDGIAAALPAPTHRRMYGTEPGLPNAITMHEAIGWGLTDRPAWTVTGGGTRTGGAEVFGNAKCRAKIGNRRPTVAEAAVLQGFPADYPFAGDTEGARYQQVGDAIPPQLAAAILAPLISTTGLEAAA